MRDLTELEENMKILVEERGWEDILKVLVLLWNHSPPRFTQATPVLRTLLELAAEKAEGW